MRAITYWPLALLCCGWLTYDRYMQPTPAAPPTVATAPLLLQQMATPEQAKLEKLVSWEFHDARIDDVTRYISKDLDMPIHLDLKSLAEAAIGTDLAVSFNMKNVPARTAIDLLLRNHSMAAAWRDGCLIIATIDETNQCETRLYPVHDLVRCEDTNGEFSEFNSLIDAITSIIEPESWKESGMGEGTISPVESAGTLAVHNNAKVHDELGRLLATLRAARELQGLRGPTKIRAAPQGMGCFGAGGLGGGPGGNVPNNGGAISGSGLSGGGFF